MPLWQPDQIGYYPVPIPYFGHVSRLIAELNGESPEPTVEPEETPPDKSPETNWTVEDFAKLLPLLQRNRAALSVLDMTAAKPDTLVSFPDACAAVGLNTAQGRAGMGALKKLSNRLGKTWWPVNAQWAAGGSNVAYYSMSEETSERWLEVRGK